MVLYLCFVIQLIILNPAFFVCCHSNFEGAVPVEGHRLRSLRARRRRWPGVPSPPPAPQKFHRPQVCARGRPLAPPVPCSAALTTGSRSCACGVAPCSYGCE